MNSILRVGTDCSGIEAPIQALEQMGIPFKHVFSSEIDKYCIKSIKANYSPEILFGDPDGPYPEGNIQKRDIEDVPDIDLYICGFPCQPFSIAGNRKGFEDKRGNVFMACLEVISIKQPQYFILENVKGLLNHDKKKTFKKIIDLLSAMKSYHILWKLLNTKDFGIPQNRERIFIIGIKKNIKLSFEWPKCIKMKMLKNYVDKNDTTVFNSKRMTTDIKQKLPKNSYFIDLSFIGTTSFPNSDKICPCIARKSDIWCVKKNRYANIHELLALQGFPITMIQVVSSTQMKYQIGNSMSVNVLKCIFNSLL